MPSKGRRFAFDPVAVGRSECDAWVAYYRRDWLRMLAGALGMVRHGFALGPFGNLKAAWHVMRANQAWAPYPDNDPEAAQRHMARFYRMTSKAGRLSIDPKIAAELEVAWWRTHREHQHDPNVDEAALVASLVRLYCYVYQANRDDVRRAAELRVGPWPSRTHGSQLDASLDDPTLAHERLALVASFSALREASDRSALREVSSARRGWLPVSVWRLARWRC